MAGEHIVNLRVVVLSTASLKDAPFGAERLIIGRSLHFSSFANSMFTLKFGKGGSVNGPDTNLFFIQCITASGSESHQLLAA
jgi:hypothetical protein